MNEDTEFDPAKRHLCPDGACTGLVGADGRCAVCGRDGGPAPVPGALADPFQDDEGGAGGIRAAAGAPPAADTGGFDASRKLCDDGSCVGVIGPDGKCGVCGRMSAS